MRGAGSHKLYFTIFLSNVTGQLLTENTLTTASVNIRHMTRPVAI